MNNVMTIGGHRAVVQFDPEIGMFRGEFVGLSGGADFYADSVAGLQREGETSLRVFLEMCAEKGIDPVRHYSGKFQVRVNEELHARAAEAAAARGVSLNQFVQDAIAEAST
ncbi:type II toxin-antitoxin system HicB family antitoxin [Gluconacetobacter diazotrophicus]|uniref:Type II toxin-antitoxin system HicB family antitoxin n=1 Tax=Gluconacetobacter diazotrophicus TaxID=33996 RepID=A0A7W4FFK5_GLUDI|nr:type II toxin-antitoxin system HicB family antitoxin [Gluconacetobacter diazotrophicus]MBB2156644.1 type II toxin-antitoxin system HicB family antitoxin [Gluconacetobacter diazotrophicus]